MSQGKRAPKGICDYCLKRPAFKTLGDSSEACEKCAEGTVDPFRIEHRLGRNDRCHCGSGKKYKHCCLRNDRAPPASRQDSQDSQD